MSRESMSCQEVLVRYQEQRDAPGPAAAALAAHLQACESCRAACERLAAVEAGLAAWADGIELPADFDAAVLARVERETAALRRAGAFREQEADAARRARAAVRQQMRRAGARVLLDGLGWLALAMVTIAAVVTAVPAAGGYLPAALTVVALGVVCGVVALGTDRGAHWLDRRLRGTLA